MARIAGAVLAAGSGTRIGTAKADLVVGGVRLLDHAVGTLHEGGCAPVIAVVRPGTFTHGAIIVDNDDAERGMRSSLELAVTAADAVEPGVDALAVLLVDTPGIRREAVEAVLAAWRPGRIAVAVYGGVRSHPTVMEPALWREALVLAGPDEGAKALMVTRGDLVDEVPVGGDPSDIDTPEDLDAWQKR